VKWTARWTVKRILIVGIAAASVVWAADDNSFFVRGATIHTMAGKNIENGSILVRNGKIVGVGQNLAAPKDVKIIEARGMQVYPGMIDSGTTVGLSEISAVTESNDVSEIGKFDPQLHASVAVNPESEHIPVTRANGITSVLAMPGGGGRRGGGGGQLLAGSASLIRLDGWTTDDLEIKKTAAMHLTMPTIQSGGGRGGDFGGFARASYEQQKTQYEKDTKDLNDFFDDARHYAHAKAAHSADFRTDLKMEAMLPVIDGTEPVVVTATREKAIRDAIAFADKQKIKIILSQAAEAYKVIPEIKAHNIPVILPPTLALPLDEDDPYDQPPTTPSLLYKAGIKFAFASFSNEFSRNLPYQAADAVAYGLPEEEAMKAVTVNAAQIWGVASQLGTIEEGKSADFVITDGNPLITQTQVKQLFIQGKSVSLENKHKRLYDKYSARPN
jgi:imidazolonepropionase-like amidohydrolase